MNISEFLAAEDTIERQPANKQQLLLDLASLAARKVAIPVEQIASALINRETLGSTGVGQGVAIPHARFQELQKPLGIFVRLTRSIDFDAIDDEPVDLAFLLLLPTKSESDSIGALAAVARKLRSPSDLAQLRRSKSMSELYRMILRSAEPSCGGRDRNPKPPSGHFEK